MNHSKVKNMSEFVRRKILFHFVVTLLFPFTSSGSWKDMNCFKAVLCFCKVRYMVSVTRAKINDLVHHLTERNVCLIDAFICLFNPVFTTVPILWKVLKKSQYSCYNLNLGHDILISDYLKRKMSTIEFENVK